MTRPPHLVAPRIVQGDVEVGGRHEPADHGVDRAKEVVEVLDDGDAALELLASGEEGIVADDFHFQRLGAVGRFADQIQLWIQAQKDAQPLPHNGMIIS